MKTLTYHSVSTLTDRYQTTIPEFVRAFLGINKRGKIGYRLEGDRIYLVNAGAKDEADDPVINSFLSFLEKDMIRHPERLTVLDEKFFEKSSELTSGVDISDMEGPLADE